jgi:hypothetical protein
MMLILFTPHSELRTPHFFGGQKRRRTIVKSGMLA